MATDKPTASATPEKTYPIPAYPDIHLPPTLDWYRQAANWLVGLATGALAVGLSSADKIPFETRTQQWVAGLCIALFLVTVGSGIAFYFWITSFANCLERREKFTDWHKAESNDDRKATYLNEHIKADQASKKAGTWYARSYNGMMISFLTAVVFMVFVLAGILNADSTPEIRKRSVFTANGQSFMIDEKAGTTWLLTSDTLRQWTWQPIVIPVTTIGQSAPVSTTR